MLLRPVARCLRLLALLGAFAPVTVAAAQAELGTSRFDVVYSAAAGCPDARAFTMQVLARTARAELAVDGTAAQSFGIVITHDGAVYRGTLRTVLLDRTTSERTIVAEHCADVAAALGLVAALTVDPNARTQPLAKADLDAVQVGIHRAPEAPTPLAPTLPSRQQFSAPEDAPEASTSARKAALDWAFSTGIALDLSRAFGAGWLAAPRVHAGVELWPRRWYSPALQLSGASGSLSFAEDLADVAISSRTVRVEGCPVQLVVVDGFAARPCLFFDGGDVTAEAASSERVRSVSRSRAWYALGFLARLSWLSAPLLVQAHAGAAMPLRRDTFSLAPSDGGPLLPVHEVPRVGAVASLGVGLRFQ